MRFYLLILSILIPLICDQSFAQVTTAFTYQGKLEQSGSPATGNFDFEFELFDAADEGSSIAGPITVEDVIVDGGLFTTEVDFGADVFGMSDVWLEIRVREGTSTGAFTILSPRERLTPAPLSLHTLNVEPGAVGMPQVDSKEVQLRVGGSCAAGSWVRAVNEDGTVICEDHPESAVTAAISSDTTIGDFILLDSDPTVVGSMELPSSGTWLVEGTVSVALTTPEKALAKCRVGTGPEIEQSLITPTDDLDRVVLEYTPRTIVTVDQQNLVVELTCTGQADGVEPPTILPNTTVTFTAIEVAEAP